MHRQDLQTNSDTADSEKFKKIDTNFSDAHGQFLSKEGLIGLSDEDNISHVNTLLHEVLHAIIYQWGLDVGDKEEHIVNVLANATTTVLVDNPQLIDYLKQEIKEG